MARIAFRDFSKYLNLSPPEDEIVANSLRRARGVHPVKTNSLRSRPGCTRVNSLPASSLFSYRGSLYTFTGSALYKDASNILSITSDNLSFLSFPPVSNIKDWLFLSNGGTLYKVNPSGTASPWGITPPIDGFTATKVAAQTRTIDMFEDPGAVARWSVSAMTLVADTTNFIQGAQSLQAQMATSASGIMTQNVTLDLSTFSDGTISSDADHIAFQVRIDNPINLYSIEIQFSLNNTAFSGDILSYVMDYTTPYESAKSTGGAAETVRTVSQTDYFTTEDGQVLYKVNEQEGSSPISNPHYYDGVNPFLQQVSLPISSNSVWTPIRIAKSSFARSGSGAYTWANVKAVKFIIKANVNGAVNVNIDKLELSGGNGMQGNYQYYITYFNNDSGNRSNPNPTPVLLENVLRQKVTIANLPTSTDSQVTHVEIWRTLGGGSVFFYAGRVANGVSTFTDTIADIYVMDPRSGASYLSSSKLYLTNTAPLTTFGYCETFNSSVFWTNTDEDNTGNLYYSRIGYAESNEGFIRVTTSGDYLQRPVLWNGMLWVFSKGKLFMVWGNNPYYSREVYGVPGTIYPETIVPTPYGIMYQSLDGVRLFNGTSAERIGWPQIGRLCSGDNVENLTSFIGTCATWGRNEYIISDGLQTLAYHKTDDTWRDLGLGFDCLYTDPLTKTVYGGNSTGVYKIEEIGTLLDDTTAIPYEVQTKTIRLDVDKEVMVNYLFLDAHTNSQNLDITLITEKGEIPCGKLNTPSRKTLVIPINRSYQRLGLRLEGSLTSQVEIFGIELDADINQAVLQDKYFKNLLAL